MRSLFANYGREGRRVFWFFPLDNGAPRGPAKFVGSGGGMVAGPVGFEAENAGRVPEP